VPTSHSVLPPANKHMITFGWQAEWAL